MDTHELSANLPPPRDDEPPSLRQDILDELADHLRCALRREMLVQDDEAAARKRVLDKFGDPREVARKLWVQAQWSRIMSQRITLGLLTLTTAACLVLAGLMWQTTRQNQQANTALLEQMAKLIEASRTPVPPTPDATLTVRLFNGEKRRPASKWNTVTVLGSHLQNASVTGARSPDKSGVAEFGVLPPGAYRVSVQTNRGTTTRSVKVLRGESLVEDIICPDDDLRQDSITVACEWPEDLKEMGVGALAVFAPEPLEFEDNTWQPLNYDSDSIKVLVTRQGFMFIELPGSLASYFQESPIDAVQNRRNLILNLPRILSPLAGPAKSTVKQHWTGSRFKLSSVALMTAPDTQRDSDRRLAPGMPVAAARMTKGDTDWPVELDADYVVKEGQPWRITIPDHLIAEARKQMAEPPPAAKAGSPF